MWIHSGCAYLPVSILKDLSICLRVTKLTRLIYDINLRVDGVPYIYCVSGIKKKE